MPCMIHNQEGSYACDYCLSSSLNFIYCTPYRCNLCCTLHRHCAASGSSHNAVSICLVDMSMLSPRYSPLLLSVANQRHSNINHKFIGAFQHRYMEDGLLEIWESLFGSCSSIMSTFSNTRKRKHDNDVKCEMTQTYKKARIEAEYHIVGKFSRGKVWRIDSF